MKKPRETKAMKERRARIGAAYNKVGNCRTIPMLAITDIYKAGERALEACANFHLPLTEAEVQAALENALDEAIRKVEVKL